MKEILEDYKKTITLIDKHISVLKEQKKNCILPVEELNLLRLRIETLNEEKYDLMSYASQIRRKLAPKPITPSYSARMYRGDAC